LCANLGDVVEHRDLAVVVAPAVRRYLVPAERAEPRKESRFTAPRSRFTDRKDERRLRDILGSVREADARRGEPIEARIVGVEEFVECALVTAPHAANQLAIVGNVHLPCVLYGIRGVSRARSFARSTPNSQLSNSQCSELARRFGSWELAVRS
jgi:hypothetical protein